MYLIITADRKVCHSTELYTVVCQHWQRYRVPSAHVMFVLRQARVINLMSQIPSVREAGMAQWLERRNRDWLKGRGFESLQERRENLLLQGQLSFCADSYFGIRSTPGVTAVARKRSRSFCQKCRWQVTAQTYTLRMWLCMKWHGEHRTRLDGSSFMWHQPCQRCNSKTRYKR